MHTAVLLQTVIDFLDIKPNKKYIDATFGEGAYTKAILERGGRVLAIDLDNNQIEKGKKLFKDNVYFAHGNFADIQSIAKNNHFEQAEGIVFDLGLSMGQILNSGKGFSYKANSEVLDMRINPEVGRPAHFYINTLSEDALFNLFARNSEEVKAREIAKKIVITRTKKRINTVGDLIRVIDLVLGESNIGVYRRIFQALRITVNNEFDNLKKGLEGAVKTIIPHGKIIVVTFHSLEDRIVKRFIKENGLYELRKVTKGENHRSFERSAKLRIFSITKNEN